MKLKAIHTRRVSLIVAIALSLPLSFGLFSGLYLWTSPWVMLLSIISGRGIFILHLFTLAVLVAMLYRHRWYCKWACPTGVLCDFMSQKGLKTFHYKRLPALGGMLFMTGLFLALFGAPVLGVIDPVNLFVMFFDAFQGQSVLMIVLKISGLVAALVISLIVPFSWCQRLCPLGGMQDVLTRLKSIVSQKGVGKKFDKGKRLTLGALTGAGLGLALTRMGYKRATRGIRPPASLPEEQLVAACLRCGNCVRACPTNIIRTSIDVSDVAGLLTPQVSFESAYCLPECTVCGSVCPSGTIKQISIEEKKHWTMGLARIDAENCLLQKHKECNLCRTFCEYDAVKFVKSDIDFSAWPEIIPEKCVGCGACAIVCPVMVITIEEVAGRKL